MEYLDDWIIMIVLLGVVLMLAAIKYMILGYLHNGVYTTFVNA